MLEVIIEKNGHFLQTREGEKLPRLIATRISQKLLEPGECDFMIMVNAEGCCRFNEKLQMLITPNGTMLPVVVVGIMPKTEKQPYEVARCKCQVHFPYDTDHKKHFHAAAQTTT